MAHAARPRTNVVAVVPDVELASYKGLAAPWNRWPHVAARGRHFAALLARELLGGDE